MVARESSRLLSFVISRPNKTDEENGLYANGNHQCEVIIDIVKQSLASNNTWTSAGLTDEERSSLTIVEWSEHDHDKLPHGWNCDKERNGYDLGLWSRASVNESSREAVTEVAGNSHAERVSRYLRCDLGAAVGSVRLMARVVIDGEIYTTHLSKGECAFESSIVIKAEYPLYLDVEDLEQYIDRTAFFATSSSYVFMGNVHYWTPPSGLRFVENKGIDTPLRLPGDGDAFDSTLSRLLPNGPSGFAHKVGTLTNKNEIGQPLTIGEVHQGIGLPDLQRPVKFNEQPTIMRAINLLSNAFSFPEHYGRRAWKLVDNFGTVQTFALDSDSEGSPYLLGASEVGSKYLKTFEIMLPGGGTSTEELYSNGRHQCQVEVEVAVMQLRPDGSSVQVPLTSVQRDSLTITVFSTNANEPLPSGWSCDKDKNIYDVGLRRAGAEAVSTDQGTETEATSRRRREAVDVVNRYMRIDSNASNERIRFMATIEVDGVLYSTNYRVGDITFNSSVIIGSVRPYKLWVRDLVQHTDIHAYQDDYCDIDVYYWTPPSGLRFLVNRGLDSPLYLPWEGRSATSSYNEGRGFYVFKGGIVYGKDAPDSRVLISDIFKEHPHGDQKVVRFNERPTMMRAVRYRENSPRDVEVDHRSKWRLWDNYGCEQVYMIEKRDSGNLIGLIDG